MDTLQSARTSHSLVVLTCCTPFTFHEYLSLSIRHLWSEQRPWPRPVSHRPTNETIRDGRLLVSNYFFFGYHRERTSAAERRRASLQIYSATKDKILASLLGTFALETSRGRDECLQKNHPRLILEKHFHVGCDLQSEKFKIARVFGAKTREGNGAHVGDGVMFRNCFFLTGKVLIWL